MVEAAGIEPASPVIPTSSKDGLEETSSGRHGAQVGHPQEVEPGPACKRRTGAGLYEAKAGRVGNTTETQRRREREGESVAPDLQTVVDAWPRLPDAMKEGILAMVRAAVGAGDN